MCAALNPADSASDSAADIYRESSRAVTKA